METIHTNFLVQQVWNTQRDSQDRVLGRCLPTQRSIFCGVFEWDSAQPSLQELFRNLFFVIIFGVRIVKPILLVGTLGIVKRTVWRKCILMLGCKGFKKVLPENSTKRVVYGSKPTFRSGIPRAYNFCFSLLFCLQFLLLSRTTTQVIIWYDPQVLLQSASTLFSSHNKDVWDVVQQVIIIGSVSEQVCTYPSP